MIAWLDLPLYVLYALAGTSAAATGKLAVAAVGVRQFGRALIYGAATGGAILASFGLLLVLLRRADLSAMVPIAVGVNLASAAVISILVFRERLGPAKLTGLGLIALGVICLSVSR